LKVVTQKKTTQANARKKHAADERKGRTESVGCDDDAAFRRPGWQPAVNNSRGSTIAVIESERQWRRALADVMEEQQQQQQQLEQLANKLKSRQSAQQLNSQHGLTILITGANR